VRSFEARYPGPTAVVQVRATLIRNADRSIVGEKMFDAAVPASDNRQGRSWRRSTPPRAR